MLPWGDGDTEFGGTRDLGPGLPGWRVWDSILCSCTYSLYF